MGLHICKNCGAELSPKGIELGICGKCGSKSIVESNISSDEKSETTNSKCPKCDFSLTSEDINKGKCSNCFLILLEWAKNTVETPTTKPEALKKLKEAKEHLELELITQDDYDKLKNELSPIIMSSSDEESETNQPESTPTNQKTSQQSQQKPSESKKRSKWVYIGIVVFILWLIGVMMPPTSSSSGSSSSYSTSSYKYYCDECGDGISGQPYQCILYMCTQAKEGQVASGLETFCSCSCGVEHRRKEGFKYECY